MSDMLPATIPAKSTHLTVKEKKAQQARYDAEAAEVLVTMTPALKKKTEQLKTYLDILLDGGFKMTWKIGDLVRELRDNEQKYGADPVGRAAFILRYERSILDKAAQFRTVFDEEALNDLLGRRMKIGGGRVSWPHIVMLMRDGVTAKKRTELLEQICENDWTVEELDGAIRKLPNMSQQPHAGGRPQKPHPTLSGRLQSFAKIADVIGRKDEAIWRNKDVGFTVSVEKIEADKITPELIQSCQDNAAAAEKAIGTLRLIRDELEDAAKVLRKRFEDQAEAVEEAANKKSNKRAPAMAGAAE